MIGPRWQAQLGRFGYLRSARVIPITGNYVDMAKRYRRYAIETGLFVSLKEKIARTPLLHDLIGVPHMRASILRNLKPESDRYDKRDPSKNYSLTTFAERAGQLRELKTKGLDRVLVLISGWPHLGYDRQHPDSLPPPEKAGGWLTPADLEIRLEMSGEGREATLTSNTLAGQKCLALLERRCAPSSTST